LFERIKNETLERVWVVLIIEKILETRLMWFGHVGCVWFIREVVKREVGKSVRKVRNIV
jgi:hypothetical protein